MFYFLSSFFSSSSTFFLFQFNFFYFINFYSFAIISSSSASTSTSTTLLYPSLLRPHLIHLLERATFFNGLSVHHMLALYLTSVCYLNLSPSLLASLQDTIVITSDHTILSVNLFPPFFFCDIYYLFATFFYSYYQPHLTSFLSFLSPMLSHLQEHLNCVQ